MQFSIRHFTMQRFSMTLIPLNPVTDQSLSNRYIIYTNIYSQSLLFKFYVELEETKLLVCKLKPIQSILSFPSGHVSLSLQDKPIFFFRRKTNILLSHGRAFTPFSYLVFGFVSTFFLINHLKSAVHVYAWELSCFLLNTPRSP